MVTVQVFSPFIWFLLYSFVSCSFLVLLRYSFLIFPFISTYLMVPASNIPKYLEISFSSSILILSWFGSSIPSVKCRFPLFITSRCIFPWQIPSLWPVYILTACIGVSIFFNFLITVWCRLCIFGDWSFPAICQVCIRLCIFWMYVLVVLS